MAKIHEQYVTELAIKRKGKVKLKEGELYQGAKTPIVHICEIGHEFKMSPTNILSNKGCKECGRAKMSKAHSHTHEEYLKIMSEKFNDTIIVHGRYINNTSPLKHECVTCGFEWETTPAILLRKNSKGCKECDKRSKTKSHEQYESEVKEIWGDEISLLTKYINVSTKISFKHNLCGQVWETTPRQGLKGCKYCNRKNIGSSKRFSHDEYVEKLNERYNGDIKVLEPYKNFKEAILHRHKTCGHEWSIMPQTLMSKNEGNIGCAKCGHEMAGKSRAVTHDEHVRRVNEVHRGEIEVLGTYTHVDCEIEYKHKKCGHTWYTMPRVITDGSGCPKCNNCFSKGEQRVWDWLKANSLNHKRQHLMDGCKDEIALSFDFGVFVNGETILIEFDGKQHFEPIDYFGGEERFKLQVRHDKIKNKYCEKHTVKLIRIKYTEFDNIESILEKELLGKSNTSEVITFYPQAYYTEEAFNLLLSSFFS
ncbi:hypothetical protein [Neobacillus sp. LXY-1]|uniref:hypothetical protein n=1 Tax=Neobacillus sp. LXY-1 TaxID=3379133 RepID=UPI003EDEF36A